ncbi:hypothetical protein ACLOJK_005896 [Asimina triloba]
MSDLPPGFRFFPTEEELVGFYLRNKLDRRREEDLERIIPVLDVFSRDPWDLQSMSGERCMADGEQWFYFSPMQAREAQGGRPNRITASGYWKATGSPGNVFSENRFIGLKKTMVFYEGRAPTGKKTKWKLNEYRAVDEASTTSTGVPQLRHEFSLCRLYIKSGNIRSFDRRPTVAAAAGASATTSATVDLRHGDQVGCSSSSSSLGASTAAAHHCFNPLKVERAESSSSGDERHPLSDEWNKLLESIGWD